MLVSGLNVSTKPIVLLSGQLLRGDGSAAPMLPFSRSTLLHRRFASGNGVDSRADQSVS